MYKDQRESRNTREKAETLERKYEHQREIKKKLKTN